MDREGLKIGSFMFFSCFDKPVEDIAEAVRGIILGGSGALHCVPSAPPSASVFLQHLSGQRGGAH